MSCNTDPKQLFSKENILFTTDDFHCGEILHSQFQFILKGYLRIQSIVY